MDCGSNSSDSSWGEQGCSDAAGTPDMSAPAALPSPSDAMSAAAAAVAHAVRLDEAGIIDMRDFQQMYGMWGEVLNHNTVPALRGGGALQGPPGQDPHFVTWMTAGAHPSLEHPYAVIRDNIPPGCTLRIRVANRYNTYGFEGHKSLVLFSTAPALLGRASNTFLGILYLALAAGFAGAVCALLTIVLRHRRRLGEAELLSWNQHT